MTAFDDDVYARVLGLKKKGERDFAEKLVAAIGKLDRALLPPSATHPLGALLAQGEAAIPALLDLVESGEGRARFDALDALAHVFAAMDRAPDDAVSRLRAVLARTKDPEEVGFLAKTLAIGRDEDLLVEQMKRLADDDPAVVASAARLLGFGRWAPAAKALAGLVSPERHYESRHVIWAIGEIGHPVALPALEIALAHAFRVVDCLIAIGKLGRVTSIPLLTPHIVSGFPEQKEAAVRALAMILDDNREEAAATPALGDELAPLLERDLADPRAPISGATRYFMLLCLARMGRKLDAARVKQYLGVPLDDDEAGEVATFLVGAKRPAPKRIGGAPPPGGKKR